LQIIVFQQHKTLKTRLFGDNATPILPSFILHLEKNKGTFVFSVKKALSLRQI